MENVPPTPASKRPKSFGVWLWDLLSGFGLATCLLLMLALLTWLATMEQVEHGLYPTLRKYFDWRAWYIKPDWPMEWLPEINGNKLTLPLPGGYWVCVVLFVNLVLGGIVRARKGWKKAGALVSHCGILLLLAAGAVAHVFEQRGHVALYPGESSDVAEDYLAYNIEIAEIVDGKLGTIHVIDSKHLTDVTGDQERLFRLPNLPFDLGVTGYMPNARAVSVNEMAPPDRQRVTDGYFFIQQPTQTQSERDVPGLRALIVNRDGKPGPEFLLSGAAFYPYTLKMGDRVFAINLTKRLWPLPFSVRLEKFTADFYPGTFKAKSYVSEVTRTENGHGSHVVIQMNEPMRYEGITFFQASYGPEGAQPGDRMFSVFEVVKNPSDKWPEYSLYVVAAGMLVHFVSKFVVFLNALFRKKHHV